MQNAASAPVVSNFGLHLSTLASPSQRSSQERGYLLLKQFPTPDVEALWLGFLGRAECPDLFVTPHYFLEPHWKDKNPFAILIMNENRVTGVVTGLDESAQVTCGLPSRPQMLIDPAADVQKTAAALVGALTEAFSRARVITAYSWSSTPTAEFTRRNFRVGQLEGDLVLDLRPGADALFQSFHENRKRNIRTAVRRGVQVSEAITDQDLEDYWEIHRAWMKTERKAIFSNANYESVAATHRFRTTRRRFLARFEGKAIAATTVRFYPGGLIEYAANCSVDEFNPLRPNDLLIWKTIQWACEQGFTRYSLGGAHPFLRKCGGVIVPIYRYRLDRTFLEHAALQERLEEIGRHTLRRFHASKSAAAKRIKRILAI